MSNPNTRKQTRKTCVVPKCKNTTTKTPEKLFFMVPMDVEMRMKWIKAMKRSVPFGDKSTVYCCEDHFDIENDMENYVKFKLVGGKIKLKKGVVPYKFECQKENNGKPERSAVRKRNNTIKSAIRKRIHIEYVEELLKKNEEILSLPLVGPKNLEEVFVEDDTEVKDPLGSRDDDQKILKKHIAVQVKLKNKVAHKSTMTEEEYFKKNKKVTTRVKEEKRVRKKRRLLDEHTTRNK